MGTKPRLLLLLLLWQVWIPGHGGAGKEAAWEECRCSSGAPAPWLLAVEVGRATPAPCPLRASLQVVGATRDAVRAHPCLAPKRLDGWMGDTRDDEDPGRSSLSRGLTLSHLNSERPTAKILFESVWGCGRGRHPKVMMPAQVGS